MKCSSNVKIINTTFYGGIDFMHGREICRTNSISAAIFKASIRWFHDGAGSAGRQIQGRPILTVVIAAASTVAWFSFRFVFFYLHSTDSFARLCTERNASGKSYFERHCLSVISDIFVGLLYLAIARCSFVLRKWYVNISLVRWLGQTRRGLCFNGSAHISVMPLS